MGKTSCCDKGDVKKGPWSSEEDEKLKAYVEKHGTGGNWIALPRKIGLKRCGKSCRLRWLNYLRPNIRHGGFTEEEDSLISSLFISIGSRWSIIAAQLPGRTDNDIKNYWNTRLKKKLLGRTKESTFRANPCSKESSKLECPPQGISSSAIERIRLHLLLNGHHSSSLLDEFATWHKIQQRGHMKTDEPEKHAMSASTVNYLPSPIDCAESNFRETDLLERVSLPMALTSFELEFGLSSCFWDSCCSPDLMFEKCLLGYDL